MPLEHASSTAASRAIAKKLLSALVAKLTEKE